MPVVINELELVVEPPAPTPAAAASRPPGMTPLDVHRGRPAAPGRSAAPGCGRTTWPCPTPPLYAAPPSVSVDGTSSRRSAERPVGVGRGGRGGCAAASSCSATGARPARGWASSLRPAPGRLRPGGGAGHRRGRPPRRGLQRRRHRDRGALPGGPGARSWWCWPRTPPGPAHDPPHPHLRGRQRRGRHPAGRLRPRPAGRGRRRPHPLPGARPAQRERPVVRARGHGPSTPRCGWPPGCCTSRPGRDATPAPSPSPTGRTCAS